MDVMLRSVPMGRQGTRVTQHGGLLTLAQVATALGVLPSTVKRRVSLTRAKVRAGEPLLPTDIPEPIAWVGGKPRWARTEVDKCAQARRVLEPVWASGSEVRPGDVILHDGQRLYVRQTRDLPDGSTRVRLSRSMGARPVWRRVEPGRQVKILRRDT